MSLVHFLALCLLVVALLSPAEAMRPLRQKLPSDRNRNAWAHLQGAPPEDVKSAILAERPDLKVQIVPHDAMVTMDMREDRVRLFVKDGKVVRSPRIG